MDEATAAALAGTEAARLEREMKELAMRWAKAGPAQTAWRAEEIARGLYVAMLKQQD